MTEKTNSRRVSLSDIDSFLARSESVQFDWGSAVERTIQSCTGPCRLMYYTYNDSDAGIWFDPSAHLDIWRRDNNSFQEYAPDNRSEPDLGPEFNIDTVNLFISRSWDVNWMNSHPWQVNRNIIRQEIKFWTQEGLFLP